MESPISLYLDLKPGSHPDLAVVAKASLAFAEAIEEVAFLLDPTASVRVEFSSGTPGSLSLNSIIKSPSGKPDKSGGATLVAVVLLWFANAGGEWVVGKTLDVLTTLPLTQDELSQEEIERVAILVEKVISAKSVNQKVQRVYSELERDEAIQGVGASPYPGVKPPQIIPRSEFLERAGLQPPVVEQTAPTTRKRSDKMRVELISPVLVPGDRRWKFNSSEGEFGAAIRDQEFLQRVLSGRMPIPMISGIEMDVLIETSEEKIDGVWTVKERAVTRVFTTHKPVYQEQLDFAPVPNQEPNAGPDHTKTK